MPDVVFSSRFLGGEEHRVLYFWHAVGNKFLTLLSNMRTNLNLTDIESGYKVFKRAVIEKIHLEEDRFGQRERSADKVIWVAAKS